MPRGASHRLFFLLVPASGFARRQEDGVQVLLPEAAPSADDVQPPRQAQHEPQGDPVDEHGRR